MTILDFLSQHTGLLYWAMIFAFIYGILCKLTSITLRDKQKFPEPGEKNTYVTNNYWPGPPQEFVTGEAEEGAEVPPSTDIPQNKDIL